MTLPSFGHRPRRSKARAGGHLAITLASCVLAHAGEMTIHTSDPTAEDKGSAFESWWNGKQMTGNWFGVRDSLEDRGLKFKGNYYGAYFGVIKGGGEASRGFWDQGIQFSADLNFGKLFDVDQLNGVKGFGVVRWRDPRGNANPNSYADAASMFNPTNWSSGVQWRLLSAGMEIGTDGLLSVEDMVVLRGGWLQPQKEFIDQPLSKLFLNTAINSSKGVGGNIPFSSSFSTWGGTLKVKPVDELYLKGGLFMAFPSATSSGNHGLAMNGFGPDTSQNGLMAIGELGWTPKFGASELEGRYAFGGYYWGVENTSFFEQPYEGQYGFYWQADQMLYREPSPAPEPLYSKGPTDGRSVAHAKTFKEPVSMEEPKLSDQGLRTFNLISFAPKYNNDFPFYFQSGFVYQGLFPSRDRDLLLIAIGYGSYSFYGIEADQAAGNVHQSNYTGVIEGGYRFAINGFSFVQPFAQYIFQPDGTGETENAGVLGFYVGADF